MTSMPLPRRVAGLSELADAFPVVLCDVWGVVHDGLAPLQSGIDALIAYRRGGGIVMLISNAPRPAWSVWEQMDKIGVDRACADGLITSGDVTRATLGEHEGARIFHLGPERDFPIYQGLAIELCDLDSATLVSCTGLFDDQTETPEDYDAMFEEMARRHLPMICANPDIVVESGDRLVPCAGAMAARYAELGGAAVIIGKPHPPIYAEARKEIDALAGKTIAPEQVLAIGDGASTDMVGANRVGFETMFIASGIHAAEFGAGSDDGEAERVGAFLMRSGTRASYFMPRLSW
jgi:HAD superfamily hydrolase (TIGR01459 family)